MLLIKGLGDRIRRQREKRGLKQQDIAHALQVSPQAVSKWERGENAPDINSTAVPYRAWFQCIHCLDQHYALTEIVYRCKSCGGLLEVRHDMAALKALEPDKSI